MNSADVANITTGFTSKTDYIASIIDTAFTMLKDEKSQALEQLISREEASDIYLSVAAVRTSFAFSMSQDEITMLYLLAGALFSRDVAALISTSALVAPNGMIFTPNGLHPLVEEFILEREPQLPSNIKLVIPEKQECYHNAVLLDELRLFFRNASNNPTALPSVIQLCGRRGIGRRFLTCQLAAENGLNVIYIDCDCRYFQSPQPDITTLYLLTILYQSVVCLIEPDAHNPILHSGRFPIMFAITGDSIAVDAPMTMLTRMVQPMTVPERSRASLAILGEDLGYHSYTMGQIIAAKRSKLAEQLAGNELSCKYLMHNQASEAVNGWERIEVSRCFDDLILPDKQKSQLSDICSFIKQKEQVFEQWGFSQKISYGKGITMLFYGASGTGKTMAAGVMANYLNMQLYRVDLSQLISKYIGETQKNIGRVFDSARGLDCILFFDEADALFARRSDQSDAQDKYSNAEIAYLLQKTESYDGVMILATNLLQNFDEAFRRRIGYMIHFPLPNQEARCLLWQGIFPKAAPVVDIDFTLLSELELSGAAIKNCALNSAYIAAASGSSITMQHIIRAAEMEYQKQGSSFPLKFQKMMF